MPLVPDANEKYKYHVQINGGAEQVLYLNTPNLKQAAIASLMFCNYRKCPDYDVIKIWTPGMIMKGRRPRFVGWSGICDWSPAKSRRW